MAGHPEFDSPALSQKLKKGDKEVLTERYIVVFDDTQEPQYFKTLKSASNYAKEKCGVVFDLLEYREILNYSNSNE